ncbi:MAG: sensor histidine kinase [Clostridia bacterium]|nr:sensor histidine kinase [Clostridia bacterium]
MTTRKLSFQKKLYLYFFTLDLVLLAICSIIFYYYTTNSLKRTMHDTIISNTSMLTSDLDNLLEAADSSLKELQTNDSLLSEAKNISYSNNNYFSTHVPTASSYKSAFRSVIYAQDLKGSISYVSKYYDNIGVSSESGAYDYIAKSTLRNHDELSQLFYDTIYVSYAAPHEDYWGHNKTVFSVARAMRDTYYRYGLFVIDYDISSLTNLLNYFETPQDYSISILDADNNMVYSSDSELDQDLFYSCYKDAISEHKDTFSHDNFSLSCYETSAVSGWTFILTTNNSSYLDSMKQLLLVSAVLFLSLFAAMSIFLYLVTRQLAKPIKQLSHQLMTLEPGKNINIQEISSNDEIVTLTNAVQAFLAEIYDQNQRLTEARRRTLQAHYDAMEAQLNPHFLYNTLSVIGMTGLSSGNTAVSTMCSELANLLRYSLSYTGQSVRLEQEIANAESYLYIMKMRYEDDLMYEWNLDTSLNDLRVPKLILQPLIENCFQHGFRQTEYEILPPWKIRITSKKDEQRWYLSISNNGALFDVQKAKQLQERIRQFKLPEYTEISDSFLERQGFGLENTILRLNIYYRGEEFFNISSLEDESSSPDSSALHSEKEEWTTVTIGGPLKFEKNM